MRMLSIARRAHTSSSTCQSRSRFGITLLIALYASALYAQSSVPDWPAGWLDAWDNPSAELRPLQIVHGVNPKHANVETMRTLKNAGLGGIVCNIAFDHYLSADPDWDTLVSAVEACKEAGLLVWIYDEQGYPSGAAGGLVLKKDPRHEAMALAYDRTQEDPFIVRPSYEHTHASNNFFAARRYPNLLDHAATRSFIDVTHAAYLERLKPYFGTTIRATFTDEPSLLAVNIGQLSERIRKRVRVQDPVDETVEPLPSVPWAADLPDQYRKRYGEDLVASRRSLFEGDSQADRRVRRQFWSLIADLIADRYFGQIQVWCQANKIASSGHTLHEEMLIRHVPFEGNGLKVLSRMDIPGLDMLSSKPEAVIHGGWMAALLPASAAWLNGRRLVMTEVSDFSERLATGQSVSLPFMQATASWQAALGVTEFTLYYGSIHKILKDQPAEPQRNDYGVYCDHVGRLTALLRSAEPAARVLLYYPVHDLWAEYLPVAEPLAIESQSPRARRIVASFNRSGSTLLTAQIPFALCDHEMLASAEVRDGQVRIGGHAFSALVLPAGAELPDEAARTVQAFTSTGGALMQDDSADRPLNTDRLAALGSPGRLQPASGEIVLGYFTRQGREILVLVNVSGNAYEGTIQLGPDRDWWSADPASGKLEPVPLDAEGRARQSLPSYATRLIVG